MVMLLNYFTKLKFVNFTIFKMSVLNYKKKNYELRILGVLRI